MKITINTKEDSLEDINKIIILLQSFIGNANIKENTSSDNVEFSSSLTQLFDNDEKKEEEIKKEETSSVSQILMY